MEESSDEVNNVANGNEKSNALKRLKKQLSNLKKKLKTFLLIIFPLKAAYGTVDIVFEVLFVLQLFRDGHKIWGFIQMGISIGFPYIIYGSASVGLWFSEGFKNYFEKDMTLILIFFPLVTFIAVPILVFVGFYHLLQGWMKSKERIENNYLWVTMTVSGTFASSLSENVGFIFKVYLMTQIYAKGFYSISLIIMNGMYLLYLDFVGLKIAIKTTQRKFSGFEIIGLPFIITLEKATSVMFILVMLLEIKALTIPFHAVMVFPSFLIFICHSFSLNSHDESEEESVNKYKLLKKSLILSAKKFSHLFFQIYPLHYLLANDFTNDAIKYYLLTKALAGYYKLISVVILAHIGFDQEEFFAFKITAFSLNLAQLIILIAYLILTGIYPTRKLYSDSEDSNQI